MANNYYTRTYAFAARTKARGEEVAAEFDALLSALDSVEADTFRAIKFPVGSIPAGVSMELPAVASERMNSVIGFDANGDLQIQAGVGRFRNNWATAQSYLVRDIIVDPAGTLAGVNDVWICNTAHTSAASLATDAANWSKLVDVGSALAAQLAAEAARDLALTYRDTTLSYRDQAATSETNAGNSATAAAASATTADLNRSYASEWAGNNEDVLVSVAAGGNGTTDYSSKHHAIKSAASAVASEASKVASQTAQTASETARDASQAAQTASEGARDTSVSAKDTAVASLATFLASWLGNAAADPTVDGNGDPLGGGEIYYNTAAKVLKVYEAGTGWINLPTYTAAQILASLLTVDGAGSGLDADLLDGLEAAAFAQLAVQAVFTNGLKWSKAIGVSSTDLNALTTAGFYDGNTLTNAPNGGAGWFYINVYTHANNPSSYVLQEAIELTGTEPKRYYRIMNNGSWTAWRQVWEAGNQGAGTGSDADKLDGQEGAFYQNADNLTAGTVPVARLPAATTSAIGAVEAATTAEAQAGTAGKFPDAAAVVAAILANTADNANKLGGVAAANYMRTDAASTKTAGNVTFNNSIGLIFGTTETGKFFHNGTNHYLELSAATNNFLIRNVSTNIFTFARATGSFTATGDITAYSDRRVKKNILPITHAMAKVMALGGYTFDRTDIEMPRQTGVIAQEVQGVLPEAVKETEDGKLSVAYGNMVGLLIEALKELGRDYAELNARLEVLEAK